MSPEANASMLEILKGQTDNDKIAVGLAAGSVFAHKTGEVEVCLPRQNSYAII